MAAPTPTIDTHQSGGYGVTLFHAVWANTDNFTDSVVVNLSELVDTNNTLAATYVFIAASTGLGVVLEYDCGTDQLVGACPIGSSTYADDITASQGMQWHKGMPKINAGGTGDIVVTTTSAASGDELWLKVEWFATR